MVNKITIDDLTDLAAFAAQRKQAEKIRLGVLGLGNQAFEHLQAALAHDQVEIVAAADFSASRQTLAQQQFQHLQGHCYDSLDAMMSAEHNLQGLVLALPHHCYPDIWDQLMKLGLPLLKEKPLGRDYLEAKAFMDKARLAKVGLQTAIQRREHPSYQFLKDYLSSLQFTVQEVHAHLHLGKGKVLAANLNSASTAQTADLGWRGERSKSGGGALLDAGYHLIDLLAYVFGDFEVVSATMWNGQKADNGNDIEDRCWLMARAPSRWMMLDVWVQGQPNGQGGFKKSEAVLIQCAEGVLRANREGVWFNDQQLFATDREWLNAMRSQLSNFASNIQFQDWGNDTNMEQLPAMRKIEEAYRLSSRY